MVATLQEKNKAKWILILKTKIIVIAFRPELDTQWRVKNAPEM